MEEKPKANASISIPKEADVTVDRGDLRVPETCTVTIRGTLTNVSTDEYGDRYGMNVDSISIKTPRDEVPPRANRIGNVYGR